MELLECKNLSKSFDNKKILKDINLIIPRGKIVGLLGKNGQGKTAQKRRKPLIQATFSTSRKFKTYQDCLRLSKGHSRPLDAAAAL